MIILKNQFNGKSGEDIWSSLILSLPLDEILKMAPRDQIDTKSEAEDEEEAAHQSVESKSEHESETVEIGEDHRLEGGRGFDEEDTLVELVAMPLEAAASKKGKMSKTKTVKDLRQEYDKFARWVIQLLILYQCINIHQEISNVKDVTNCFQHKFSDPS